MSEASVLALAEQLVLEWPVYIKQDYGFLAASTLVLYDYFLTFPAEVTEMWRGNITLAKILFYANRYSAVVFQVLVIMHLFLKTDDEVRVSTKLSNIATFSFSWYRCIAPEDVIYVFYSINAVAGNSIFVLRTYALYNKNVFVLIVLCLLGGSVCVTTIVNTVSLSLSAFPSTLQVGPYSCIETQTGNFIAWTMAANVLSIVFDGLVFCLTLLKTINVAFRAKELRMRNVLAYLLVRDGSMYFTILLLINLIMISVLGALMRNPANANLSITLFISSQIHIAVQSVLVNRLVLNLSGSSSSERDRSTLVIVAGFKAPNIIINPLLRDPETPVRRDMGFDYSSNWQELSEM